MPVGDTSFHKWSVGQVADRTEQELRVLAREAELKALSKLSPTAVRKQRADRFYAIGRSGF